jgi:beta-barrel assembly-enhancing protease
LDELYALILDYFCRRLLLKAMGQLLSTTKFILISVLALLVSFSSFSQKDFNNYQTLLSQGEMPLDFKSSVADKVAQDLLRTDLSFPSKTEAQAYWTEVHTELNDALYSGNIIYGDEISTYVRDVAANLLKNDHKLLKKLRFYTIKSNEVNAFSTAPGIIFVTTGLISQLSSEAQLAFILSHEIAHYEKNHSYNEYINLKKAGKIKRRDQVLKLSQFSKEQEFEADETAIKRYYDLGYSREDLLGTFDILMYSYLPFDEIVFPNDYFNTEHLYIPVSRINKEIKEITAREDYDDNYHTHPNIKKRKEAIQLSLEKYSQWGKIHFILDEKTFREAVKTCRFEDVRTNLIQGNPFNALYSIFLLERMHPKNQYLEHMKAAAWLSMQQTGHIIHERFENPKIEGESSKLSKFLKQAKRIELATIGLRVLYDLKKNYPDDAFIENIYNNYLKELSSTSYFELSKFQKLNYHQAASEALVKKNEPVSPSVKDSVKTEGDKYSRIREKRETQQITVAFDSTE